nr:DDE-type integrase/transposase/recombinase [Roseibium aggregatum]
MKFPRATHPVVVIGGVKYWLWQAIDGVGNVLDILVQTRQDVNAARRFFGALVTRFGELRGNRQAAPLHLAGSGPYSMSIIALTRG